MQLVLTEDQELLAKTAADFVAERSPGARMRELRDANDPTASRARSGRRWPSSAGWASPSPRTVGGADMGLAELAVVLEPLGRTLAPEPFLSTVLLAGQALLRGGSEAQQQRWLPRLTEGDAFLALAHQEPPAAATTCTGGDPAERDGDGWRSRARRSRCSTAQFGRCFVIVGARTGRRGGRRRRASRSSWCRRMPPGLEVERQHRGRLARRGAAVTLDGVAVGADAWWASRRAGRGAARGASSTRHRGPVRRDARLDVRGLRAHARQYLKDSASSSGCPSAASRRSSTAPPRCSSRSSCRARGDGRGARAVDEGDGGAKLVSLAKARCSDAAHAGRQRGGPDARRHRHDGRARHRLLPEARPGGRADIRRRRLASRSLGAARRILLEAVRSGLDHPPSAAARVPRRAGGSPAGLADAPGRALPARVPARARGRLVSWRCAATWSGPWRSRSSRSSWSAPRR